MFGSDRSAVRLALLLARLGHEVNLAVPRARPERGLMRLAAEHAVAVEPAPIEIVSSRGVSGIGGSIGRRPPSPAELTIYNTAAVARRYGDRRPRVLIVREWLSPEWRRHRALCRMHGRRLDGVVAVSRAVAERWRECARVTVPVDVCPNWLGEDWLSPEPSDEREGVLFLGRLNAWKGQLALADAFERAFERSGERPSLTFVGAEGRGTPFHRHAAELRRRSEGRGWRLLDFTPSPRKLLRRAALVVIPSLRPEPFGNVILEGLASGARVIAFPGGGVDDLAPLFPASVEVVPRERDALAAALARWWREGAKPQSADEHDAVLETLHQHFSVEAVAPRWAAVIERLSQPSRARPRSA